MRHAFASALVSVLALSACSKSAETVKETAEVVTSETSEAVKEAVKTVTAPSLADILDAQPETVKARYVHRNPEATLKFFGVKPGMTVAEVLPGGGWYTKILLPAVGDDGSVIGIDYNVDMWAKFGGFVDDKFLEARKGWADTFIADANGWSDASPNVRGFAFGGLPEDLEGSADVVLMVRAFHHINRFEQAHLAEALADVKAVLKPDGIVGMVQHRAPEDQADDWANGDNGYMKQSTIIQLMSDAGFELVGDPSEINANPKDVPDGAAGDSVWRLPPTLGTSREKPELKAKMEAIGETDRMTLKFRIKSN